MKRVVWANKSNNQLCLTIPKGSGIKEGDVVHVEKQKINRVVYSVVTGDLFHFGHLRTLQSANEQGDLHVCGVLTNEAIATYKSAAVADFKERKAIISALQCVDMVIGQENLDPTENLKKLRAEFPQAKFTLVYGSNWKKVPGADYIKKIEGIIFQPPFYEKLSSEKIKKKLER